MFLTDGKIITNKKIGEDIYQLEINSPEIAKEIKAGQFVKINIPDGENILRRPLSINDVNGNQLTFIYKVIGDGTQKLAKIKDGYLNLLGPLGNTFPLKSKKSLIVGGGLGIVPLYLLAKSLAGEKIILLGAANFSQLNWAKEKFLKLKKAKIYLITDDGSLGKKGYTTDFIQEILENVKIDQIYTCGPKIMMKKVNEIAKKYQVNCLVSLEKRMACGLGACLSCTIETLNGRKKVCKDGPIFQGEEVFFNEG